MKRSLLQDAYVCLLKISILECQELKQILKLYAGTTCGNNIEDCPGNCNVANTMRCTDLVQDYGCECKEGFTGRDCEVCTAFV